MKSHSFQMGFEIKTAPGAVNTPTHFIPWKKDVDSADYTPTSTLKYMNDALIGMNYHTLNQFKNIPKTECQFVKTYLKNIDPYFEIYANSASRLKVVTSKIPNYPAYQESVKSFETRFNQFIDQCFEKPEVQLKHFSEALTLLNELEQNLGNAFLYNFSIQLSENFTSKLISLYSFLFHLRTVAAMNHNNQVEDSTFESIRCDSINDYLAKTDFTVNDALMYWQFKKLATPFVGSADVRVEKLLVNPLEQSFLKYNHNACSLINHLPESFLTHYSAVQLEESLHQIQIDWLLGSSCGLLFRLREEFYGIQHGYDKIFWPEAHNRKIKKNGSLKFCFELMESDFITTKKAA